MNPFWLKINKSFIAFCLHVSSFNHELGIPSSVPMRLVDDLTLVWSCVIMLTSTIKFFTYPKRGGHFDQSSSVALQGGNSIGDAHLANRHRDQNAADFDWVELALLNYLPRINQFSALYYGLVLLSVGTALIWRVYLRFRGHSEAARNRSSRFKRQFNAKRELMDFFMNGPTRGHAESDYHDHNNGDGLGKPRQRPRQAQTSSGWKGVENIEGASKRRRGGRRPLLTIAHTGNVELPMHHHNQQKQQQQQQPDGAELALTELEVYRVPIRSTDVLRDKSQARWNFLAVQLYTFVLMVGVASLPLTYFTVGGLLRVNVVFGPLESVHMISKLRAADFDEVWTLLLDRNTSARQRMYFCLGVYAVLEQAYVISQLAMFFVYTNILIKLIHADLIYKAKPFRRDIKTLCELYASQLVPNSTLPIELIRQHQLRVWAYFDQIRQFDTFLSKYSVASLAKLSVGIAFVQSFFVVYDKQLKHGTLAAIFSNILSFTYLYFISEHIERQSIPFKQGILAVLAYEKKAEARREWQRLLYGFFQSDWRRTFTINGRYPTNLRTFSKIVTALLAACLLVHRLFHRSQWNVSFATSSQAAAPITFQAQQPSLH